MWELVRGSESLDLNSAYAYLLAFRHHSATSVVADDGGTVVGFVLAYRPPQQPDTVFVWQVGVAGSHRGQGLGRRLLHGVLARDACEEVRFLEATVTPSNEASMRLFSGVARDVGAELSVSPCFEVADFPEGESHEPEQLVRIGPIDPGAVDREQAEEPAEGPAGAGVEGDAGAGTAEAAARPDTSQPADSSIHQEGSP